MCVVPETTGAALKCRSLRKREPALHHGATSEKVYAALPFVVVTISPSNGARPPAVAQGNSHKQTKVKVTKKKQNPGTNLNTKKEGKLKKKGKVRHGFRTNVGTEI